MDARWQCCYEYTAATSRRPSSTAPRTPCAASTLHPSSRPTARPSPSSSQSRTSSRGSPVSARFWPTWTYAFSAEVSHILCPQSGGTQYREEHSTNMFWLQAVFGFVVTRGPRSPLASSAIQQLDTARELFAQAAVHSRRAARALVSICTSEMKPVALILSCTSRC